MATWTGPIHAVGPEGITITLPGVGRSVVSPAGEARVDADPGADPADVEWFRRRLVGEAVDVLAGRFGLRASAVEIAGKAVALVGAGASGKSFVAAALARRGHPVLADSYLRVDPVGLRAESPDNGLELWPAAFEHLALDPSHGEIVRPALPKLRFHLPRCSSAQLSAIYRLSRKADVEHVHSDLRRGGESLEAISRSTAAEVLLDPLGLRGEHFAWITRLADAVEVVHVSINRHRTSVEAVAAAIEERSA